MNASSTIEVDITQICHCNTNFACYITFGYLNRTCLQSLVSSLLESTGGIDKHRIYMDVFSLIIS